MKINRFVTYCFSELLQHIRFYCLVQKTKTNKALNEIGSCRKKPENCIVQQIQLLTPSCIRDKYRLGVESVWKG